MENLSGVPKIVLLQIRHGDGGFESERGVGGPSQSATDNCRGNTSYKEQEEEQEADHS
jgi:hypothetical protein